MAMKMLHDCRWSHPAAYKLEATEKLVFQWLLGNKDTSISGVYTVMTGAIQDGVGYHVFDNNVKGSPVYPTLDKLVDSGLITYDKPSHTLRIVNYHKFRPFGNGSPLVVLQTLNKEFEAVHNQEFFVNYVEENQDIILKKINDAKGNYENAVKKGSGKLINPDDLEFTKFALNLLPLKTPDSKPKLTVMTKESFSLVEKEVMRGQLG